MCCRKLINKINNLIKQKTITVPFSAFEVINGGEILGRYFVEAFGYEHNIKGTIISTISLESRGYDENVSLTQDYSFLICSCFVTKSTFNSEFYMKVLVTYI